MIKLLLVEDDEILSDSIKDILEKLGEITQIYDGEEGLFEAQSQLYDLIVLDIMLPSLDGYQVLNKLRQTENDTPVLLLTAKDGLEDKIKGFKNGADDYLTKPFHREELLLRCQAMLKRSLGLTTDHQLRFRNTLCDTLNHTVTINEKSVEFQGKEFELLVYLFQQKNRIVTKEQIFDRIWGFDSNTSYTVVEVYMSNLRKKLKANDSEVFIKTLRNVGYLLGDDSI
ncbi:response regulator transcription factor [Vagococcus salmoninarum]|uniref:DNA-binding response regulator n=1 Tax=Vagococcus salmoninarum TaxID=2739 RepID=A0A429ZW15_9ENTE|nr:response regulator transcription factor [Vagococcus salmoninarum]RST97922.1 DNA-binding response regulator [Vagococcus salmoninarum]